MTLKQMSEENENLRQEYGLNVLAYGHPKDNDGNLYGYRSRVDG